MLAKSSLGSNKYLILLYFTELIHDEESIPKLSEWERRTLNLLILIDLSNHHTLKKTPV